MTARRTGWVATLALALVPTLRADDPAKPIELGSRRELFVDRHLIDRIDGVSLRLEQPRDEGIALKFDKPWEGAFCGYCTILHDGGEYRAYYRGSPDVGKDGSAGEVTCVAVSKDGLTWTKPELALFGVRDTKTNNVVLAGRPPYSHNFCPMIDPRPGVPKAERYKALAGTRGTGLCAFASEDGLRWRKLREEPVITKGAFDSQNVPFWSASEGCYLCYFRVFVDGIRRIARTTSVDFLTWTEPVLMGYGDAPVEHLYTNQTHPYFRAPHIYVGVAARFMPGRQVLTPEQAKEIGVNPGYFRDCSDGVLLTTRGGDRYDRTFPEGFLTPGIGPENWVSRTNYPALNVVQTGPAEMSLYANQNYGQPTSHLRRYSLRLDGFAAAVAPYAGGELVTKPLTFAGKELVVNFATSAAGGVRVEIQDAAGQPVPGFALADAVETIGNEIERVVRWKAGGDVSALAGKPVRLRFALKDARLYSFRFRPAAECAVPLALERFAGPADGPRVLVTGGVHGDEFEPMTAIRRLIVRFRAAPPARGSVKLVPVVNEPAFRRGSRIADDGLDLARTCPGRPDGSVTERIAHELSELIRGADYYIDLHTGGTRLRVLPMTGYTLHPDPAVLAAQRRMACAFGLPIVWGTDPSLNGRSLSVARDAKVPAIYAEYHGGGGCDPAGVDAYATGCLRVLADLGMTDDAFPEPAGPLVVEDPRPGSGHMQVNHPSPAEGFFEPAVELGQRVREGDLLGTVTDLLGQRIEPIRAAYTGIVLVLHTFARIDAGVSVAVILPADGDRP